MQLELGEVAVIVGGASGIGQATAQLFTEEQCQVAVWDIAAPGDSFSGHFETTDVRNMDSIAESLKNTVAKLGPIDHLVYAAAVGSGSFGMPFTNVEMNKWGRVLDVNILGLANVANAVCPEMIQAKKGTVVSVSSVAGQVGSPTDPPYSASKAAAINFAQCMARDLAPYSVRVNTVCPGMVRTPLNRSVWQSWRDRNPANTDDYDTWAEQKIRDLIPLGRWQSAQDIADMIVFLSSKRAAQVTGQTINVDGGYVMHW